MVYLSTRWSGNLNIIYCVANTQLRRGDGCGYTYTYYTENEYQSFFKFKTNIDRYLDTIYIYDVV